MSKFRVEQLSDGRHVVLDTLNVQFFCGSREKAVNWIYQQADRKSSCEHKVGHTDNDARQLVGQSKNTTSVLRQYKCEYCPMWHITGQPPRNDETQLVPIPKYLQGTRKKKRKKKPTPLPQKLEPQFPPPTQPLKPS